ncbi:hypothetical protein M9H77_06213 [Catharanthus roseus]|uniref:Uncharacterized protein n=1 Tax=Catharanthus roseus TaxID=4058 RepID=A0ACC0BRH2_CATRO|nr:hypothetical protein M9H77_06213 [Catharanthus roseus]
MVEESHFHKIKKDAYYLASSDSPGLIITIVQLKENDKDNNYAEWAKAMCLALRSKKKLEFKQHRNLAKMDDHGTDGVAFAAVKLAPTLSPSTNSRQICSHCRRHGHVSSSCFYLVSFPNWQPKNSTTVGNRGSSVCWRNRRTRKEQKSVFSWSEVNRDRDCRHRQEKVKKMVGSMLRRSNGKECLRPKAAAPAAQILRFPFQI